MKIFLIILSTIILVGCCKSNTGTDRLPTKIEYLRIGFENTKEVYIQINGTGIYDLYYGDLRMAVLENPELACSGGYEKIANDVTFYSVVSESEYNSKHLNIETTPTPEPETTGF